MITIISDNSVARKGEVLAEGLGAQAKHFVLDQIDIKPCYSCGGCKTKTFKRCIVRDDADRFLPYIAQSETLVIITPITFGSYSHKIKLLLDKLALLGDVHYYVNKKEMVKGKDPSQNCFYVVGITEEGNEKEINAFTFLVKETLHITNWIGKPFIRRADDSMELIVREINA